MCSEEARRIRPILKQVEQLLSLCRHNQEMGDDNVRWSIAQENLSYFHVNLCRDLMAATPSPLNDADFPEPRIRSIKDVQLEYENLTMEYYQKPGVRSTEKMFKDGKGVAPSYTQSALTPLDPVENDESPHSSQLTNRSSNVSGKEPDDLPPPGGIGPSHFEEAFIETPPASQSSALMLASLPAPRDKAVNGKSGVSEVMWTPTAAPSHNSSQLSSSYGSSCTVSPTPIPDRVEDKSDSLADPAQSFPTPANNAVERGSSPSNYNYYSYLEAQPSNHIEMPSSSGIRAFPSQPYNYMRMPPSSTSCARAQTAPISCNERIPCSSPTEIRPYYKSSNNSDEIKSSWPKGDLYNPASPLYPHVNLDPELSRYQNWFNSLEDSITLAQPYPEPLLSDNRVGIQSAFNSTQFGQAQSPRPTASNRGTQASPEPLPFGEWYHAQPTPSRRASQPGPGLFEPFEYCVQRQPSFPSAQFINPRPPRAEPSSDAIQHYAEPLRFDDRAQRQPALHRSQFDHTAPPRPAVSFNDIQSYVDPLAFDDRAQREQDLERVQLEHPQTRRPAASSMGLQPDPGSRPFYKPPRRAAAAAAPTNHVHRTSNNTQGNPSPAYVLPDGNIPLVEEFGYSRSSRMSTSAPVCTEEVTIIRKCYYPRTE